MEAITRSMASGSDVRMNVSDSRHFNGNGNTVGNAEKTPGGFQKILFDQVNNANNLQVQSDQMEEQMMTSPDSVNVDEVMIASEKARLSVSFLKSISEKAIRAYNDIMMIR